MPGQRADGAKEDTEVPMRNDASRGTTPATTNGSTRVGSQSFRDAAAQARALLAAQDATRRERRAQRWSELAEQLLQTDRRIATEEALFVAASRVVKGERSASLTTAESMALREVTRRVWMAADPGENQTSTGRIEEATTAATPSDSDSVVGDGSTAAVNGAPDGGLRSFSPAPGDSEYFDLAVSLSRAQFKTLGAAGEVTT